MDQAKIKEAQQANKSTTPQLVTIVEEMAKLNEMNRARISNILETLNRIHPLNEKEQAEKVSAEYAEESSLISSIKNQLVIGHGVADSIAKILRHVEFLG